MNFRIITSLLLISNIFLNCKTSNKTIKVISGKNYELTISNHQKAVLILFPCFPCDLQHTKKEAKFLKNIENEGITTLLLNYNQKLYLTEAEKIEYGNTLIDIFQKNEIDTKNIYFGGFSSGGNLAVVLSNYLLKTNNAIQPKGLIVVDSPLDLEQLYKGAEKDILKNVSAEAVEEGNYLISLLDNQLGNPKDSIENYKKFSPYLISSNSTNNLEYLKDLKIRFYAEPDLEWQFINKNRTYEELNSYQLDKAYQSLLDLGTTKIDFIKTKNRGYTVDGEKRPHSWNIVEKSELVKWLLE